MFDKREGETIDLSALQKYGENDLYFFHDELTGKELLLKVIKVDDYCDEEMLLSEFYKLIRLSSEPEVVTAYFLHTCTIDGEQYTCYSMDYLKGQTLKEFLLNNKEVSFRKALSILEAILSGIKKAHFHDIVHCDLHDENIIITKQGFVKIIDFHFYLHSTVLIDDGFMKDLASIKEIALELRNKLSDYDKKAFDVVLSCIREGDHVEELLSDFYELKEVSLELSFCEQNDIDLLHTFYLMFEPYLSKVENVQQGFLWPIKFYLPDELIDGDQLIKTRQYTMIKTSRKPPNFDTNFYKDIVPYFNQFSIVFDRLDLVEVTQKAIQLEDNQEDGNYFTFFIFRPSLKMVRWLSYKSVKKFLKTSTSRRNYDILGEIRNYIIQRDSRK